METDDLDPPRWVAAYRSEEGTEPGWTGSGANKKRLCPNKAVRALNHDAKTIAPRLSLGYTTLAGSGGTEILATNRNVKPPAQPSSPLCLRRASAGAGRAVLTLEP